MLGPQPVVTGDAFLLGKRSVEAILNQAIAVRPMRRMARHTVSALHRVTKMGLLRFAVLDGMARHTKSFTVLFDQVLVIRGVGRVAAKAAALLDRIVLVFLGKAACFGMAAKAEFITLCRQKARIV